MEFNFTQGQRLIIELITREIYEGEYVAGSKNRIEVNNACDYITRSAYDGMLFNFYRSEINSIRILDEPEPNSDVCECPQPIPDNTIKIAQSEYESLKETCNNFVYISTIDSRFFTAMEKLSCAENIGVVGLSDRLGRASGLTVLVCSTWDQVYIFDLMVFNKKQFPRELQAILESKDIKKVLHDSRMFVDCMCYCYKVRVRNIFDTQVADFYLENGSLKKTRNLGECLSRHFNFPENLLENAMTIALDTWKERPLSDKSKLMAAQQCVYLITLKNHFEKELLKDFYSIANTYSTSTLYKTAVEAQNMFCDNDISEISQVLSDLKVTRQNDFMKNMTTRHFLPVTIFFT